MSIVGQKLSREEWKQKQDLDAARKAGTVPAEVDAETGRDINPHIPQYISQAPWYIDTGATTLRHQRTSIQQAHDSEWYKRGVRVQTATKYRKGACENCGAITHKTKDCVERPRKVGARFTGQDIQGDEIVGDFSGSFDAKRDRWNGYDAEEYKRHIEEWEKIEQKRKEIRAEELSKKLRGEKKEDDEDEQLDNEDKYAEDADMAGQKLDMKTRTTVRNLRIREDTAKYLRNLDVNSAHYDPKTRSLRENPNQEQDPTETVFAGDNAIRLTGDVTKVAQAQLFVWDASEKGSDVHLQANPTQAELLIKEVSSKKQVLQEEQKNSILAKYGGAEHLVAPPKELLFAQSENYVEYSRTGQVIKGQELAVARSKYEEDVYINNHTSVWGSYWEDGRWGYKCCQQFVKNSYCTGKSGIEARQKHV